VGRPPCWISRLWQILKEKAMLAWDVGAILLGYLLGSIPFAHLITSRRTGLAIREVGEGNAGARNVWHVVGPNWGLVVGLLDGLKGLGAVLLARALGASEAGALLAGPAAILGHAFPLFLHFQGGKGVATTAGVLMGWMPWSTLAGLVLFVVAQVLLHNFNRSIVVGVAAGILLPLVFGYPWTMAGYALLLFCSLALKKWLDLSHERRVWAASAWQGNARPGWYQEEAPVQELPGSGGDEGGSDASLPDCHHHIAAGYPDQSAP
jgi:glycerol-3-phosphate acyltransferase PlsY